jgi:hypothetical protein
MKSIRHTAAILGACGVAALATACGSSSPPSSSSTTSPPTSSSSPAAAPTSSSPAAGSTQAQIESNWTAFFAAKTPVPTRVKLLEDGQEFQSILKAQSGHGLASSAAAKVLSVGMVSTSRALVKYDILVAGAVALPDQSGDAVLQNGTWKVGVQSFCGLLKLEGLRSLPAACSSSG